MVTVRTSQPTDAQSLADILNGIIKVGGTTALSGHQTAEDWHQLAAGLMDRSACHVACNAAGQVIGFQYIVPHPDLPDDTLDVATFVRVGIQQGGVGTALFQATKAAARRIGAAHLMAVIRKENTGGQTYYGRMGFVDLGETAEKVMKRYSFYTG